VHVGQSDIPARLVRQMIGPDKILGISVKTPAEAAKAQVRALHLKCLCVLIVDDVGDVCFAYIRCPKLTLLCGRWLGLIRSLGCR
jgi:hypothetical protein